MITDNHKQSKGSDWIDIIWASYENAFVNANCTVHFLYGLLLKSNWEMAQKKNTTGHLQRN